MKEIGEAFEVLSDPEKKKIFDQYGEEALKGGIPSDSGTAHYRSLHNGFKDLHSKYVRHSTSRWSWSWSW